jgi:hypothetical protein
MLQLYLLLWRDLLLWLDLLVQHPYCSVATFCFDVRLHQRASSQRKSKMAHGRTLPLNLWKQIDNDMTQSSK